MMGVKKKKKIMMGISALFLPFFILLALWNEISWESLTYQVCLIAFLVLCGLEEKR